MKRYVVPVFMLIVLLVLQSADLLAQEVSSGRGGQPEPPVLGIHWARGFVHASKPGGGGSPDMTWHGGGILTNTATATIFWGTSWSNPTFVGDKISGLDLWYAGISASSYGATSDEYTGSNGQVTDSISFNGHYIDTTAAPTHAPRTSTILNEVCRVIPNPVSDGYYAVYVDTPRGGAGYCAWHSYGSCGTTPVQFAFFFNLDGDPGCDPQSTITTESQGLAALANVSGHELSEARTDPRGSGWYDSSGQENGDKCAWTFGGAYVTFPNGTNWKIQGNWSNYAYDHSTGYPNSVGQKGCVDGANFPGPFTN